MKPSTVAIVDKLAQVAIRIRGLECRLELDKGPDAVDRARQLALTTMGLTYEQALERELG